VFFFFFFFLPGNERQVEFSMKASNLYMLQQTSVQERGA